MSSEPWGYVCGVTSKLYCRLRLSNCMSGRFLNTETPYHVLILWVHDIMEASGPEKIPRFDLRLVTIDPQYR